MYRYDLEKYIAQYHRLKGWGRKYAPFYSGESDDMQTLIKFVAQLDTHRELSDDQLLGLYYILSIKSAKFTLTQSTFLEIYNAFKNELDPERLTFEVIDVNRSYRQPVATLLTGSESDSSEDGYSPDSPYAYPYSLRDMFARISRYSVESIAHAHIKGQTKNSFKIN